MEQDKNDKIRWFIKIQKFSNGRFWTWKYWLKINLGD